MSFGVPTTCWWVFGSRNRDRQNLAVLRAPFERTRRGLANELLFGRFQPTFEEICASKGRSTRQGKRITIQPRKTLGRARASQLLHGPNQVGIHRSETVQNGALSNFDWSSNVRGGPSEAPRIPH